MRGAFSLNRFRWRGSSSGRHLHRRERERIETARREKEERAAAARRAQEEAKARAYDSLRQRHETLRTTPDAVLLNGHVNVQGGGSIVRRFVLLISGRVFRPGTDVAAAMV